MPELELRVQWAEMVELSEDEKYKEITKDKRGIYEFIVLECFEES